MNKDDREVCEWTLWKNMYYMPKCGKYSVPKDMLLKQDKCCRYCGKPIKIKGDK